MADKKERAIQRSQRRIIEDATARCGREQTVDARRAFNGGMRVGGWAKSLGVGLLAATGVRAEPTNMQIVGEIADTLLKEVDWKTFGNDLSADPRGTSAWKRQYASCTSMGGPEETCEAEADVAERKYREMCAIL